MRIKCLLLFLVLSFAPSGFALDTHFESEEEIKFANELFTQKEKDWSNIWTFDFSADAKYVEDFSKFSDIKVPSVLTIPHFKFYKSADLTGEVFAQIDDKGLKVGDNYICQIERGSKWTFILTQKKGWDSSEKGKGSRVDLEDDNRKILKSVVFCKDFFLYVKPGSGQHFTLQTTFPVINHKIGKVKMRGVDVYFDATAWISTYYAETDALTTLNKVLTQDDFDQIYELIKKLRKLIEAEDKDGIFTLVTGKKIEDIDKIGMYGVLNVKRYFKISKEEFLNYKFDERKKKSFYKATTLLFKKFGLLINGDISPNSASLESSLFGYGSYISFERRNKIWKVKAMSFLAHLDKLP